MNSHLHKILVTFLLLGLSIDFQAQKLNYEISDNAGKMFDLGNYKRAKELYRSIYKDDLTDLKVKYLFGVCLIYTYEEEDGIKTLESIPKKSSPSPEITYHLARGYHLINKLIQGYYP